LTVAALSQVPTVNSGAAFSEEFFGMRLKKARARHDSQAVVLKASGCRPDG
jgi:hypothetical protein